MLRGLQRRTEGCTGSRGGRPSTERRRDSALDGRRPRDPCHPSLRRCNPLSTAAAQSKSPGSKFFRKKRLSPREHGACCCDCDRGAPAHDVLGTPDTPPCGAATLAARQRPAPAPDPTPTAAEIFRVPTPFREITGLKVFSKKTSKSERARRSLTLPFCPCSNFQSPAAVP